MLEEIFTQIAVQYGYLGAFIISFVGSTSIIIPLPYTIIFFFFGFNTSLNIFWLAIAGGLGSGFGEMVGYVFGRFANRAVGEKRKKKLESMLKIITRRKYLTPFLIFLFALTPLPDDLIFIPLGLLRFPIWRILIPSLIGKFLATYLIIFSGRFFYDILSPFLIGESNQLIFIIITSALLILVLLIIWRIDWEGILNKIEKKD
jgi:membrane protein YqaA with SNARE-associated domain